MRILLWRRLKKCVHIWEILSLCLICSACQATPEDEIVAGKDAEVMESALHETAEISADDKTEDQEQESSFSYSDKFVTSDQRVNVIVDAEVYPITGNIPVYRVRPKTIEVADVQKWADFFFQGQPAYDRVVELSKSEIQDIILDLKQEYDPESLMEEYGTDPENLESVYEYYETHLAYYEALYPTAPEEVIRQETTWEFRPSTYYAVDPVVAAEDESGLKTTKLMIETEIDGLTYEIWATNRDEEDFILHRIVFVSDTEEYGKLETTEDEARTLVKDTLNALGMDNWEIATCTPVERENGVCYYTILCRNSYDGIPAAIVPELDTIKSEDAYAAHYNYETVEFQVSNHQVCSMWWENPLEIVAVENENVKTLSWEEVLERFRNQMEIQYSAYSIGGEGGTNSQYFARITHIEQNLTRVTIPDQEGEFYLIPAWHFYGTASGVGSEPEGGVAYVERPLLSLSALDGTVINTALGY